MRVDYVTLGPRAAIDHDGPRPLGGLRQRTVLAVLLVSAERTVSVDEPSSTTCGTVSHHPSPWCHCAPMSRILRRISAATDARTAWSPTRTDTDSTFWRPEWMPVCSRMGWPAASTSSKPVTPRRPRENRPRPSTAGGPALVEFRDRAFNHHEIHRLEACRADAVESAVRGRTDARPRR